MMIRITIKALCICIGLNLVWLAAHAQKPALDLDATDSWSSAGNPKISADGKFISYSGKISGGNWTLFLRSSDRKWQKLVRNATRDVEFSGDSKQVIYSTVGDSLYRLTLGGEDARYIARAHSFRLAGRWLVYKKEPAGLQLTDLSTGAEKSFSDVRSYLVGPKGNALVLQSGTENTVSWIDLKSGEQQVIWQGKPAGGFFFDSQEKQLAFTVPDIKGNAVVYYRKDDAKARLLTDQMGGIRGFSKDDRYLFYYLVEQKEHAAPAKDAVKINVWSYKDAKLQAEQLAEGDPVKKYLCVVNPVNNRIFRLEEPLDHMMDHSGDMALVIHRSADIDDTDRPWFPGYQQQYQLVSLSNGAKTDLPLPGINEPVLSPGGKFLLYYDTVRHNFASYELSTRLTRNITGSIVADWTIYGNDHPDAKNETDNRFYWLKGDTKVLIHDLYDIWLVDPYGAAAPVNLTNGYGRRNNITFALALTPSLPLAPGEKLLLTAFNHQNKTSGFFSASIGEEKDPDLLTMGPYVYYLPYEEIIDNGQLPRKAANAAVYIVCRMNAEESPNYFLTGDFKKFRPLSEVYPERNYNWLRSELVSWKDLKGRPLQGVLYKPENFDPNKKYPVIFFYYEKMANNLHVYLRPMVSTGLNIPLMVSNGYLVFTPDIAYQTGHPGESAFNSVVSAARYLSHLPCVDSTRMGLQGHSFGGYETNYIITHTSMFAAACAGAGPSDLVSNYDAIWGWGAGEQGFTEHGQVRMGGTLWQIPERYIAESPIFRADKVTTPVLLLNNKDDGNVPFSQGTEFFTALRRLGKRAWMLQYDGEKHTVEAPKAARDYTTRMTQFFDYYLKGKLPPKWMTQGIPASMKQIDDGLALDNTGKTP